MSAVGLGQQRSAAVGPGSNLWLVRYFYDFTDIYEFTEQNRDTPPLLPIIFFRYQKFYGKQEVSFAKFFVSVL